MLPPAGQIFEKLRPLENLEGFSKLFEFFKLGASRGAASGGSAF